MLLLFFFFFWIFNILKQIGSDSKYESEFRRSVYAEGSSAWKSLEKGKTMAVEARGEEGNRLPFARGGPIYVPDLVGSPTSVHEFQSSLLHELQVLTRLQFPSMLWNPNPKSNPSSVEFLFVVRALRPSWSEPEGSRMSYRGTLISMFFVFIGLSLWISLSVYDWLWCWILGFCAFVGLMSLRFSRRRNWWRKLSRRILRWLFYLLFFFFKKKLLGSFGYFKWW